LNGTAGLPSKPTVALLCGEREISGTTPDVFGTAAIPIATSSTIH
jgi:hypothetical protein